MAHGLHAVCKNVCHSFDAIWSPDNAKSGSHKNRRCEHGSRNVLPSRQHCRLRPKVRAYVGVPLPRSTRTIWKILHKHQMIAKPREVKKRPLPPRAPLEEVQMDFKDVTTVPSSESPQGKKQHVVEVCNF